MRGTAIRLIFILIVFLELTMPLSVCAIEPPPPDLSQLDIECTIPPDSLRNAVVFDAGNIKTGATYGVTGNTGNFAEAEYGDRFSMTMYPALNGHDHGWMSALMIGGIVDGDTIIDMAYDIQTRDPELKPYLPRVGGITRVGDYADDEFLAVCTDIITDPEFIPAYNTYDGPSSNIPLGIELTQHSYNWSDTAYNDFIVTTYQMVNIGENHITDGWIGFMIDPDYYDTTLYRILPQEEQEFLLNDDQVILLDTILYSSTDAFAIHCPMAFDDDGDPDALNSSWTEYSVRHAMATVLLNCSLESPDIRFNWWYNDSYYLKSGFAPRQLGTPQNPMRRYAVGDSSEPASQADHYYTMAFPEVDYSTMEVGLFDTTNGWLSWPKDSTGNYLRDDLRYIYSFGPFDMMPGDTITFTMALVGGENIHVDPGNYADNFSYENPWPYFNNLDLSDIMTNIQKADSVYRSGFILPDPGPPVGLKIVDFSPDSVTLGWRGKTHPRTAGYYIDMKDTSVDNQWHRFPADLITDTVATIPVFDPSRKYLYAVGTVAESGRESPHSMPISCIPGRAHTPDDFAVALDSIYPVLSWSATPGTMPVFNIYRSLWDDDFKLYDSTCTPAYRDNNVTSGTMYRYRVSALDDYGYESVLSDSIAVIPMALDHGVLFYDLNDVSTVHTDAYRREYLMRLVRAMPPDMPVTYHNIADGRLSLPELADYQLIIFDNEKDAAVLPYISTDSIGYYLAYGGKAIFITLNASHSKYSMLHTKMIHHDTLNFFNTVFCLDSTFVNAMVFLNGAIEGDLTGCQAEDAHYPTLAFDAEKLNAAPIPINGAIPLSGVIYPRENIDILYRYQSLYPDSLINGAVNGIHVHNDNLDFIVFHFPLSLMREPENILALHRAMTDLDFDADCGDVYPDGFITVGDAIAIVRYLYKQAGAPIDVRTADVNCDGFVDMADALIIINKIFKETPPLNCCPPEDTF